MKSKAAQSENIQNILTIAMKQWQSPANRPYVENLYFYKAHRVREDALSFSCSTGVDARRSLRDGYVLCTRSLRTFNGRPLGTIAIWLLYGIGLLSSSGAAHATDYHVSAQGDDAASGTTPRQAWRTLARAAQQSLVPGDRLLLRGGDTFTGSLTLTSQGDAGHEQDKADTLQRKAGADNAAANGSAKPDPASAGARNDSSISDKTKARLLTLGSYGRGRATIEAQAGTAVTIQNAGGWRVTSLILRGGGRTANRGSGLVFRNTRPGNVRYDMLRINDIEASGFGQHGILIEGDASDKSQSGYKDVRITRCAAHDNAYTGIYVTGVYDTKTTRYANADVYVGHCTAYDNTGDPQYLENHSGSGIFLQDVDGGIIERCVARNNGALCACKAGGPIGIWAAGANNIVIQYCESHHNHTGEQSLDGGGFDFDGGVTNSVLQYNYAHDNDGAGYLIYSYPNAPYTFRGNLVRYNISQNDGRRHHYAGIYVGGDVRECSIFNNTVFISPSPNAEPCALIAGGADMRYCNNLLVTTGGVPLVEARAGEDVVLRGNAYWSSGAQFRITWNGRAYDSLAQFQAATRLESKVANSGDAAGLNADPLLTQPGGGPTLDNADRLHTLTAYRLRPASPLVNAGVNLPIYLGIRAGDMDFYGTLTPQGHDYDIGAYEKKQ